MKPSFGLVVTTLGRLDALRALLASLDGQLAPDDHIVLVAQGNLDRQTQQRRWC